MLVHLAWILQAASGIQLKLFILIQRIDSTPFGSWDAQSMWMKKTKGKGTVLPRSFSRIFESSPKLQVDCYVKKPSRITTLCKLWPCVNEGKQLTMPRAKINFSPHTSILNYYSTHAHCSADQVLESNGTLGLVPICFWNYYIISILRNICIDRYDHLIRPKEEDI